MCVTHYSTETARTYLLLTDGLTKLISWKESLLSVDATGWKEQDINLDAAFLVSLSKSKGITRGERVMKVRDQQNSRYTKNVTK